VSKFIGFKGIQFQNLNFKLFFGEIFIQNNKKEN
jgi:hypothetical protein